MGYVKKIGKNKYSLYADLGYRGKKRVRKYKTVEAKNEKEAKRLLILFEEELSKNKEVYFNNLDTITLNELYSRWRDEYAKQHYSIRGFRDNCNHLEKRILPILEMQKYEKSRKLILFSL